MTDGADPFALHPTCLSDCLYSIRQLFIPSFFLSSFARDLQLYCCCNRSTSAYPILQAIYTGPLATYRRFKANVVNQNMAQQCLPALPESAWILPTACPDARSYETATPAHVAQERQPLDSNPDDRF